MDRTKNTNQIRPNNESTILQQSPSSSAVTPLDGSSLKAVVQHPSNNNNNHGDNSMIFVNKGLELWEKGRREWLSQSNKSNANSNTFNNSSSPNRTTIKKGAIDLNIDDVIDCIVSNRWRTALKGGGAGGGAKDKGMFSTPVPLPQMIDILTDLWEAEGLDN